MCFQRVLVSRDGTPSSKIAFEALPRRSVQVLHGFNLSTDGTRVAGFDVARDPSPAGTTAREVAGNDVEVVDNYIHDAPYAGIAAEPDDWRNVTITGGDPDLPVRSGNADVRRRWIWLVENNEIERLIRLPGGHEHRLHPLLRHKHFIRRNFLHGTGREAHRIQHGFFPNLC